MELKKSQYNIVINENEDKTLFYNSSTSALVNFNREARNLYDQIENKNIEDLTKEEKEYLDIMIKQGFVISKDIDEKLMIKVRENIFKYNSKMLVLTVAPTMNCNMKCPYCYESKGNSIMSEEVENDLLKFIENKIKFEGYQDINLTWYGGEPLLCKDIIFKVSKKIIDLCDTNKINYISSMVSNGTLLDRDTAIRLKEECRVNYIQITLDGVGETNNKRRLLKNNEKSFDLIVDNIKNIKDVINIQIRANLDKSNYNEIDNMIEFFYDNELKHENINLYFAPVQSDSEFCFIKKSQCYSAYEFAKINLDVAHKLKKYNVLPFYPFTKLGSCGATSINSYVVDPDGDLYKCWNEINIKEKKVGNLKYGDTMNGRLLKWLSVELKEECKECKIMPMCQGGCPYSRVENNEFECDYNSINYKENLELYYQKYIENNTKKAELIK